MIDDLVLSNAYKDFNSTYEWMVSLGDSEWRRRRRLQDWCMNSIDLRHNGYFRWGRTREGVYLFERYEDAVAFALVWGTEAP